MDIPLSEAQVIWDWNDGELGDRPPVKVIHIRTKQDDRRYSSSWGACNADFIEADDREKLAMLFRQYHSMVLADGMGPQAVHEAFLNIPEYRASLHSSLVPAQYEAEGA